MVTPAPQTKLNELTLELNQIVLSERIDFGRIDEVAIKAQRLMNFGFDADAHVLLGMIAAFKCETDQLHLHYQRALDLTDQDPLVKYNYITSLLNVWDAVGALKHVESIEGEFQGDLEFLVLAYKAAHYSYDRNKLIYYLDKILNLSPDSKDSYNEILGKFDDIMDVMKHDGLTLSDYHGFSDFLFNLREKLSHRKFLVRAVNQRSLNNQIFISFLIDGDVENAIMAEEYLITELSNMPYSLFDKYFIVSCTNYEYKT